MSFLGDSTLSNRSDGDLLIIDLFLISILAFRPSTRLSYAMSKFVTDKHDILWHESINKAKNEAFKLTYEENKRDAKDFELMYEQKIKEHEKEFRRLRYENAYLKEAFKILTNDGKR